MMIDVPIMNVTKTAVLRKSLFAGVFGGMMAVLAGCGNTNEPKAETSPKESDTKTELAQKPAKTLAISAIVEHPSLDDIRKGMLVGLADLGYAEGQNLTVNFQSAQGNMATAGQIAKQFAADNPDVMVGITTPTAQTLAAASQEIPLVYTAVSDPVAAKLITGENVGTQANITGLSSQLPLAPQLDLLTKVVPNAKRVGFVYSPGEANSVSVKEQLAVELPKRGMTLVDVPANRSADVAIATRALAGRADVIYSSLDNGVASAMEAMVQAANELKIPVIVSDEFSVRRGAAVGLGVNDFDFGRATAVLVAQILDGKQPSEVTPTSMNELTLYISPKHAQEQGISIPDELLAVAVNVDEVPPNK